MSTLSEIAFVVLSFGILAVGIAEWLDWRNHRRKP